MQEGMNGIVDPMTRDFIRVLTDFGFKRMFGSVEHAHLLLRFLNALFEGEMIIKSVEFRDKEVLPLQPNGKKVLYDIYCTTDSGDHFILEMQQVESENFAARILFYGSSAIIKQGIKGVEYMYSPVYCIVFTDFNLSGMSHTLIKDIVLTDRHTGEVYTDLLRIMFISLPEVPKEWDECDTELLRILYLIKNMENMTRNSQPYKSGLYDEFFDAASTNHLSMEEAVAYSQSYYKEIENQSAVEFAAKKAAKKAYSEGEEKGMEKGLEKGLEKGREEERIKNIEAARKAGLSDDMIAKIFA